MTLVYRYIDEQGRLFGVSTSGDGSITVGVKGAMDPTPRLASLPDDEIRRLRDALTAHLGESKSTATRFVEDRVRELEAPPLTEGRVRFIARDEIAKHIHAALSKL